MHATALIIFARKPELGKVKTRLAAQIGDEAALRIYIRLLEHTRAVAKSCDCDTHIFLTEQDGDDFFWQGFAQHVQAVGDLGEKMQKAFVALFEKGYKRLVIVGSDCPGLQAAHVQAALDALADHDVAIGPAADGGYYLLGMNRLHGRLFQNKRWSTDSVCSDTIADMQALQLRCAMLPTLHDVDTVEDLQTAGWL